MKSFCFILLFSIAFSAIIPHSECDANITDNTLSTYWEQQYQELEQDIAKNKVLSKSTASKVNMLDTNALIFSTDRTPSDVLLRRTNALLQALKSNGNSPNIAELEKKLNALKSESSLKGLAKSTASSDANSKDLFMQLSALNKEVALANPLIDFDSLICVGYVFPNNERHMCDQFNPWNINMGGGLYIIKGIKSSPTLVDVLKNSRCVNGSFKGSNLAGGAFNSPDLSYDGKTIVFAWSPAANPCYHIFKVDIDGSNLTQLTDGTSYENNFLTNSNHNDFDPAWLPNGRIVFISDRRGGYGRCHTKGKPTYTLHSMKDDGTDNICISYHETNEWNPSVDNSGKVIYSRWDYVDRDDCIAHHLWSCYPDGRDPRSYHGNYPLPLQTISGSTYGDGHFDDGRGNRPNAEFNIRAIPNSQKLIATSGPHHGYHFGELIIIDPTIEDDGKISQIKKITSVWNFWPDWQGPYGTAWPLSEDYYICNKNNDKGGGGSIILRDKFGGEQVIFSNSNSWMPIYPIPVKARIKPPALTTATWQGARKTSNDHYRATIQVNDVYNGDIPLPNNTKISSLRIVQVFPKETKILSDPRNGYPAEALTRMSLGTAPVESDGSVYCEAPVGKTIYFQLLDDKGLAVASMRTDTYVHEGEQLACIGCHENKWKATPGGASKIAFKRSPSKLTPDAGGVEPVNFARLVKPVFDKNCTPCHRQRAKGPDMSFGSLKNYAFYYCGDGNPFINGDITTKIKGGSRSTPGKLGASFSNLIKYINGSHYNTTLTTDEYKRVTLWLDLNSMELGAEYKLSEQRSGQLVWPRNDVNPANPQGIENEYPLKDAATTIVNINKSEQIKIYRRGSVISISNQELAINGASIFNILGRCIHQWHFDKETKSFNFDMKKYPIAKGTYILNISTPTSKAKQNGITNKDNMLVKFVIE